MTKFVCFLLFVLFGTSGFAQLDPFAENSLPLKTVSIPTPSVRWTFTTERNENKELVLVAKAEIAEGWFLYANKLEKSDGPMPTTIHFQNAKNGTVVESGELTETYDEMFDMKVRKYKHTYIICVKVFDNESESTLKGYVNFMTCNNEKCLPPKDISFTLRTQ